MTSSPANCLRYYSDAFGIGFCHYQLPLRVLYLEAAQSASTPNQFLRTSFIQSSFAVAKVIVLGASQFFQYTPKGLIPILREAA
jgi:hypothetical protein